MTNTTNEHILEPLQFALKLEREGKKFFSEAADRCDGELPRRTFRFLADEEDRHIQHIESFYSSMSAGGSQQLPDLDESATKERFESFRERLGDLRQSVSATLSDREAYETAIRFENGAEDFYREQIEKADRSEVKAFYEWLIREEERHARFLEDCLKFADDPGGWFRNND